MSHASLNAVVVGKTEFRNGLFAIDIAHTEGDPAPAFTAGQYAVLGLPLPEGEADPYAEGDRRRPPRLAGIVRRSYSIASPPSERRFISFYIVRVDGGKVSPCLADLRVGDKLYMSDRFIGRLTLDNAVLPAVPAAAHAGESCAVDPPADRLPDVVMLATGTGLAPFLAMLRETAWEKSQGRAPRWRQCVLLHGVREEADLGFRTELEALAKEDPSFAYVPSLTRADAAWAGRRGRVQSAFDDGTLTALGLSCDPARTHIFLCGAPGMIDETEAQLIPRGFVPWKPKTGGNLHLERFW